LPSCLVMAGSVATQRLRGEHDQWHYTDQMIYILSSAEEDQGGLTDHYDLKLFDGQLQPKLCQTKQILYVGCTKSSEANVVNSVQPVALD